MILDRKPQTRVRFRELGMIRLEDDFWSLLPELTSGSAGSSVQSVCDFLLDLLTRERLPDAFIHMAWLGISHHFETVQESFLVQSVPAVFKNKPFRIAALLASQHITQALHCWLLCRRTKVPVRLSDASECGQTAAAAAAAVAAAAGGGGHGRGGGREHCNVLCSNSRTCVVSRLLGPVLVLPEAA